MNKKRGKKMNNKTLYAIIAVPTAKNNV